MSRTLSRLSWDEVRELVAVLERISQPYLVAWSEHRLKGCPYPLDVALERFYTGKTRKHSALIHYGSDPVTEDLPAWFQRYNARQTIEAGIKECK